MAMPLSEGVRHICHVLKITQQELASRCGVDEVTAGNWTAGRVKSVKRLETRDLLRKQARLAGITIEGLE